MEKIILLMLLLGVSSCGSTPPSNTYNEELSQYLGSPEYVLYQNWGYPTTTQNVAFDEKIVTYAAQYSPAQGNPQAPYSAEINYQAIYDRFAPQSGGEYYCETSFTIKNGVIVDYNFNGDDCVVQ